MSSRKHPPLSCILDLEEQIRKNLDTSICHRKFLSIAKLDQIFTLQAIRNATKELDCAPDDQLSLAEAIFAKGRRVFAMLIYNKLQDLIIPFRKYGKLDNQLPFSEAEAAEVAGSSYGHRIAQDHQWSFCPYVFPENMSECHCNIENMVIIPLTTRSENVGEGAGGHVQKVGIPPSQQHFESSKTRIDVVQVVRKTLKSTVKPDEFERENQCLRLLNQLQHPNIVPFLGSYTYRNERHFLFPSFDMNLHDFLFSESRYGDFRLDHTFYSALAGLASALSNIHNLHLNQTQHGINFDAIGYHHDLRPQNILVRQDTFVLADFGLGRLKLANEDSYTPHKDQLGDYIGPECTNENEDAQEVNRAVDVWAFGCLIAEAVTYMLKGAEGIREFRAIRTTNGRLENFRDAGFYQPNGDVKKEVLDWMGALKRDRPFPDLISLLIDLSLDLWQPLPSERPRMSEVYHRLIYLTLRKYFDDVQKLFLERCSTRDDAVSASRRKAETFLYASRRFETWGQALGLGQEGSSEYSHEHYDTFIKTMCALFHTLEEASNASVPNDGSILGSLETTVVQRVDELWTGLPEINLRSAEEIWHGMDFQPDLGQTLPVLLPGTQKGAPPAENAPVNQLLPELENTGESFRRSLENFEDSDKMLKVKSSNDLYDITQRIQNEQKDRGELRALGRVKKYIERLDNFYGVVNEVIGGGDGIQSLLWGPLALLLQLSRHLNEAFDSVVGIFASLGRVIPDFGASISMFKQSKEAQEVLLLFYKDILSCYNEAFEAFQNPRWMYGFNGLWHGRRARILEISSHMERLARLMRTEIRLEHIQQEYELRKTALESFMAQKQATIRQDFNHVKTSLKHATYDEHLDRLRGARCQNTEEWLFKNEMFASWMSGSNQARRVLWLSGKPGSGKTVLCSAIVDRLRSQLGLRAAFAFLTYHEARFSALSAFHSLIFQLASDDNDLMGIVCESANENLRSDLTTAGKLLSTLSYYTGPVALVIDGVDEVDKEEQSRFIAELLKIVEDCRTLQIIFSSRAEAHIQRLLGGEESQEISIHSHNEKTIGSYVHERIERIFHYRQIWPASQEMIRKHLTPLVNRAEGMFLYARLVLDLISGVDDLGEMEKEMKVLPENLDDAYHRIIARLSNHRSAVKSGKAKRLLGWVACSAVPLTVMEAQQGLSVTPEHETQVFHPVGRLDVVDLLGPIVEVVGERIQFVHFTAKEYIFSSHLGPQAVDINQSTADLATQCMAYLCQRHHDPDLSDEQHLDNVITGQYCFHAYSVRMWFELVSQHLRSVLEAPSTQLIDALKYLLECRKAQDTQIEFAQDCQTQSRTTEDSGSGDGTVPQTDEADTSNSRKETNSEFLFNILSSVDPQLQQLLSRTLAFRKYSYSFTGDSSQDTKNSINDPLTTSSAAQKIRAAFDAATCETPMSSGVMCHKDCGSVFRHYGLQPFNCKFPQCAHWLQGFDRPALRRRHESSHDAPQKCHVVGCEYNKVGFLSRKMREDHMNSAHGHGTPRPDFNARNLDQSQANFLLIDLIRNGELPAIEEILKSFPKTLEDKSTRFKLQLVAAETATAAIFRVLSRKDDFKFLRPPSLYLGCLTPHGIECVKSAVEGKNEGVLTSLLTDIEQNAPEGVARLYFWESLGFRKGSRDERVELHLARTIANDWVRGVELWSQWLKSMFEKMSATPGSRKPGKIIGATLMSDDIVLSASSHPKAHEYIIRLWHDLDVAELAERKWFSRTLVKVAQRARPGCLVEALIVLGKYLLDNGAYVDGRDSGNYPTALHYAARSSSAEGAKFVWFLLLNGADPEKSYMENSARKRGRAGKIERSVRSISEEEGAKNIQQWPPGMTWEDIVKDSRQRRALS